jgi:hypothetical protein
MRISITFEHVFRNDKFLTESNPECFNVYQSRTCRMYLFFTTEHYPEDLVGVFNFKFNNRILSRIILHAPCVPVFIVATVSM